MLLDVLGSATSVGHAIEQAMRAQVDPPDGAPQALITAAVTGQLDVPGVAA